MNRRKSGKHELRQTHAREESQPHGEPALDQAESASRYSICADPFVIDSGCGVMQGLLEILVFEKRILGEDCRPIRVCGKQLQNPANRDSHTTDARLPAALPRLNRDPIKQVYRSHGTRLEHPHEGRATVDGGDCIGSPSPPKT